MECRRDTLCRGCLAYKPAGADRRGPTTTRGSPQIKALGKAKHRSDSPSARRELDRSLLPRRLTHRGQRDVPATRCRRACRSPRGRRAAAHRARSGWLPCWWRRSECRPVRRSESRPRRAVERVGCRCWCAGQEGGRGRTHGAFGSINDPRRRRRGQDVVVAVTHASTLEEGTGFEL
jgi:hypothetical protein